MAVSEAAIAFSAASLFARGCGSSSSSLGDCCFHHQYPAPAAAKPMSAVSPISEPECCRVSNSHSAAESPIPPIKIGRRKLSVIFPFLWVLSPSLTLPGLASLPIFHRTSAASKLAGGRSDLWGDYTINNCKMFVVVRCCTILNYLFRNRPESLFHKKIH